MQNRVFSQELINQVVDELKITNLEKATIGEVLLLASRLEQVTGIPFIRMDQGVPGLKPCQIGIDAEKKALDEGVASMYPAAAGVPVLKEEASRFVKAFLDVDISSGSCIPVTGSVAGSFSSFIVCNQRDKEKDTVLFIDPGFPIQKSQLKILDIPYIEFDVYNHRGAGLKAKLEGLLERGTISSVVYSNPNNPAWICLTEDELQIIGELANFAMDFRTDFGKPFQPPFVPTVARYTDNYILMLSSSKIFSYAGQRAAVLCISDPLFFRKFESLAEKYSGSGVFGSTFIGEILYMITSGITHSTQYGYAAMLKAASDGELDFVKETSEYGRRACRMKELFNKYGFHVVYDKDIDRDISDGFFFTIGYNDMSCAELMRELLYYGISSIALSTTGSEQQGIRACCSRMSEDLYTVLDERLRFFKLDH